MSEEGLSAPVIEARGVSKHYRAGGGKAQVLRGVDLSVASGELVAIVGTSGSGKTTLLNIIGGLDANFEGQVRVRGTDLKRADDRALGRFRNEQVGFVFQQFNLIGHLSVAENVALPDVFSREPQGAGRVQEVLSRVGLEGRDSDLAATLSGGQKQRVGIARALFNRAELLLCDEPTGNLDSRTGETIIQLFSELNQEDGLTLVIVTHEERVSTVAHRVLRLEDGQMVAPDASPNEEQGQQA